MRRGEDAGVGPRFRGGAAQGGAVVAGREGVQGVAERAAGRESRVVGAVGRPRLNQHAGAERVALELLEVVVDERVAKAFAETYCSSKSHRTSCPDWPARKYLDKRDSPGPRARPLKRRDLATVATAKWYATEKTDGERHWLFHDGADGCWLLRRDLSISRTFAESIPALACGGPTIFDGEIVPERGSKNVFFVVFDAVRSLGDDVGALRNAPARLAAAAAALAALAAADLPVAVVAKTYHDGAHFDALRPALAAGGGVFRDGTRTTECDGVVLAAERDAHGYYDAACFKYKPTITLDVRLKFPHHDLWALPLDVDAAVADGPRDVTVTSLSLIHI